MEEINLRGKENWIVLGKVSQIRIDIEAWNDNRLQMSWKFLLLKHCKYFQLAYIIWSAWYVLTTKSDLALVKNPHHSLRPIYILLPCPWSPQPAVSLTELPLESLICLVFMVCTCRLIKCELIESQCLTLTHFNQ